MIYSNYRTNKELWQVVVWSDLAEHGVLVNNLTASRRGVQMCEGRYILVEILINQLV